MNQRILYFAGAALFAIATGLNLYNEGANLKTGVGIVFVVFLIWMGLKARPAAR